jgi:hypothetical protein
MFEQKNTKEFAPTKERLQLSQEDRDVLAGAFAVLIKVDKRVNPQNYKIKRTINYD